MNIRLQFEILTPSIYIYIYIYIALYTAERSINHQTKERFLNLVSNDKIFRYEAKVKL